MILTGFFFNPQGDHRVSWRHPDAAGREVYSFDYYRDLAIAAEAAGLDAIFVADRTAVWDSFPSAVEHYANPRLEPLTLLAALAAATRRIGLIATVSTSYSEPYTVARSFASLDWLSGGRAAWNVVTSSLPQEAPNFGRDAMLEHEARYDRAAEFVDVVRALWDSVEDDALPMDKGAGRFARPERLHLLEHRGRHFAVRGPLNVPRPPQGHPVIVQAGSSSTGQDLAAAQADLHFTVARTMEEAQRYRAAFAERVARHGRDPASVRVIAGVQPVVAGSRAEAAERGAALERLVPERLAVDLASSWCGTDLSAHDPGGPLPPLPEEASFDGQRSNLARVRAMAAEGLSIREVARRIANAGSTPLLAGTATDVADALEAWWRGGAADGFALMFPLLPGDWLRFCREVMPELRRRGLVPAEPAGGTLRARLGLPAPANRWRGPDGLGIGAA